ncbi:MAG: TIR domain-containing protein [Anaerolineaceae bacterium]|nr:TIR domain-containing protein [Anaerolineaceae bacterium]
MAKIFISYSRTNRRIIDAIDATLQSASHQVWFDHHIPAGQDWWGKILNQISDCEIFIFTVSHDSIKSDYCRAELREAQRLNKKILPVIIRHDAELPRSLRAIQSVDLSDFVTTTVFDPVKEQNLLKDISDLHTHSFQPKRIKPAYPTKCPRPGRNKILKRLTSVAAIVFLLLIVFAITAFIFTRPKFEIFVLSPDSGPPGTTFMVFSNTQARIDCQISPGKEAWTDFISSEVGLVTFQANYPPGTKLEVNCFDGSHSTEGYYPSKRGIYFVVNGVHDNTNMIGLNSFRIDPHPVSNAQFAIFAKTFDYSSLLVGKPTVLNENEKPYMGISWYEADEYCRWRNARLATKAEWTIAARLGYVDVSTDIWEWVSDRVYQGATEEYLALQKRADDIDSQILPPDDPFSRGNIGFRCAQ